MMTARFCLVKMTAGLFKSPGGHFFRFYCCQSQSNSQKQMHSGRDRIKNKIKKQILSKNISENNVEISEMSHIIYGNIPTQIDEDLMKYRHRKSKS